MTNPKRISDDRLETILSYLLSINETRVLDELLPADWEAVQLANLRLIGAGTDEAEADHGRALDKLEKGLREHLPAYRAWSDAMEKRARALEHSARRFADPGVGSKIPAHTDATDVLGAVAKLRQAAQPGEPVNPIELATDPSAGIDPAETDHFSQGLHSFYDQVKTYGVGTSPEFRSKLSDRAYRLRIWFDAVPTVEDLAGSAPVAGHGHEAIRQWLRQVYAGPESLPHIWTTLTLATAPLSVCHELVKQGRTEDIWMLASVLNLSLGAFIKLAKGFHCQPALAKAVIDKYRIGRDIFFKRQSDLNVPESYRRTAASINELLRQELISHMGQFDIAIARDLLSEVIRTEPHEGLALLALGQLSGLRDEVSRPLFEELAKGRDCDLKCYAQLTLLALGDSSWRSSIEAWAATHRLERARAWAAKGLGEAHDPLAGPFLKKLSQSDQSLEVRRAALLALGELGDTQWAPYLEGILRDPKKDDSLRACALEALHRLKPDLGRLHHYITQSVGNPAIRLAVLHCYKSWVLESLRNAPDDQPLDRRFWPLADITKEVASTDPSAEVRVAALDTLVSIKVPGVFPFMMERLAVDTSPKLADKVIEIRRRVLSGEFGAEVAEALIQHTLGLWQAQCAQSPELGVEEALALLGPPDWRMILVNSVVAIYGSLGAQATESARAFLFNLAIGETNANVQWAAQLALCQMDANYENRIRTQGIILSDLVEQELESLQAKEGGPSPSSPPQEKSAGTTNQAPPTKPQSNPSKTPGRGKPKPKKSMATVPAPILRENWNNQQFDLSRRIVTADLLRRTGLSDAFVGNNLVRTGSPVAGRVKPADAVSRLIQSRRGVGPATRHYTVQHHLARGVARNHLRRF